MSRPIHQTISKIRRDYNSWVADETMEDYALRFAPRSFRKWSEFQVANTAFGSTSFLVLEAIGGFLSINYGFTNAFWAILVVGLVIFITSFPISYYAARYNIDIDLLTRSAGFGYIGSTITSLIYASFTFTLFALEASIMSLALELYFQMPLALAHVVSAVMVIPLVTFGVTTISKLQLWTQPVWLIMLIAPYVAVFMHEPEAQLTLSTYFWIAGSGKGFDALLFGSAATVAFSMMAQIGEQVDFLRFMPEKKKENRFRWWAGIFAAGPGWILFGMLRQLGGALLAHLAIRNGISPEHAHEPTQMYQIAYGMLFSNPEWVAACTLLFVIISQLKINVTNAYAGSLAWSNFFSRLTHTHPGRVIWLFFNVAIALLLMEFGVFGALEKVLGLFSHMSIAWISAVAAEFLINKPLKLSPPIVEFKRAYLPDLNPVGIIATLVASVISIMSYVGLFGIYPQAFSAFIALGLAFLLSPLMAWRFGNRHYLARDRHEKNSAAHQKCSICENQFEQEDLAYCPAYSGAICSLCCTLDARCLDACKPGFRLDDYLEVFANRIFPANMSLHSKLRLLRFFLLFGFLTILTSIFIGIIYYQDLLVAQKYLPSFDLLLANFVKIYASLLVFIGLCTWWLILNDESRRFAHEETAKQTQLLLMEIEEHKKTDIKLEQALKMADQANSAKSRFLSNMSHEIRTPLNSIIGYAYVLQKDPAIPEHRRSAIDILKRSGEHLSSLIEDILDIARIEARKFELKSEPINFPVFIEHLVRIYKAQAEEKGLAFCCQITQSLPQRIKGDEKRVRQILINILSNAVKFTSSGDILFRIGYSGEVATFQITDTGRGIREEELQNIFQPFTRLMDTTEHPVSGSGLGLTISKILAEIMGGELTVKSRPEQGSSFTVRLFLPNLRGDNHIQREADITGYLGPQKTVLIVDDQPEHRDLMCSILQPLRFKTLQADSGEAGLLAVAKQIPDLILLDISMPGLDGVATAIQLRQQGHTLPIIVLSANAYSSDRLAAIHAGCNDFLSKPIQIADLLYKLKLHLALDWVYEGEDDPDNEPAVAMVLIPPNREDLQMLQAFVRIGDILGLKAAIRQLQKNGRIHDGFSAKLIALADDFKLSELKQILTYAT
jgi:signal transduction histidine kinase/CheY-like chemotaxis protein/purine-cytosine permease-like protein